MSSDIEQQGFFTLEEAIKLSQKELKPIFSKPKCTSKLLAKPPFRFLHDIITATLKSSYGFPKKYFPEKELSSDFFKDKESKIKFLEKLIFLTRFCFERTRSRNQDNLVASLKKVRSSKIVAGLEPIHTNVLLVCFACVAKVSDSHKSLVEECAKEYAKQKQLKQSSKAKAKGKDTDETEHNVQSPAKTPLVSSAKKTKTKKMKKSMTTTTPSSHDKKSNKTLLTKKIKACNSDLQQTREFLISLGITKPQCSDKLLKKPPFRFLHDLIMAVGRRTGFGMDIYSDFEKESSNVSKTKSSKIQFLEKIISHTKTILDLEFEIKPAKIVSGLESDKTCKFLQLLTVAAEVSIEGATEVTTQEESSSVGAAAEGGEVMLSELGDASNQVVVDKEENDILHSSSAEGVSTDNTQKEYVVEGGKEDRIERNVHARIDPKDSSPVIQEEKAPTNDTDIADSNGEDDVEETIPSLPPSTTTDTKLDGNENSDMVVKESASDGDVSPSRPAQVDIVEEHPQEMNIDEELQLLEKTRQMIEKDLGIQKPQCSDKLLRKPPTRFLYDLFMAIEKQANGFLDSILTPEEKQSYEYVRDKKVDFLEKIVQFVYNGGNDRDNTGVIVQATKVVSGKESVKNMCKFLQDLATKALKFQSKVADATNVQKAKEKEEEEVGKTPVSQHHTVTFLDDVQSHEQQEERFDHTNDLIDSPPSSMEEDDDIDEEDFQAFLMSQDIQAKTTLDNLRPTTAKRRPPRTLSQQLGEKDRPVFDDKRRRRRVKQVELNDDYMNQSTSGNNEENSMNNRAEGPIGIIPENESDEEEVNHSNDDKIPRKVITKRKTPQDNSVESMMNIIQKSVQSSITPLGKCMDRIINQKNFVRDIEQERESITRKYLSTKEKMDKIDRRNNKIYIEPLYVTLRDLEEQILETKRAIVEKKLAIHKNDERMNRILGAMSMGGCE